MTSTIVRPARRFALTLAAAGIAALGSVAIAPAVSAASASDGFSSILKTPGNGNGPDAFILTDHGRVPVFFCDDSGKHANNCTPIGDENSGRF